jgi:predicted nicotinamide N-methyase
MSVASSDSDTPLNLLFQEDDINTTFDYTFLLPPMETATDSSNVTILNGERKNVDLDERNWSKILISLEGISQEYGQISERTGFTLWDAADVLAHYMIRKHTPSVDGGLHFFENKRVIELGTGLGLCGILSTYLNPKRVVLTDGDDRVLEKTRNNCALNGVDQRCEVKKMRWGVEEAESFLQKDSVDNNFTPGFDTVFGSDIIYDENKVDVLFATVAKLLENCQTGDGAFIVAYRRRTVSIDVIFEEARKAGFDVNDIQNRGDLFIFTPSSTCSTKVKSNTKTEGGGEVVQKKESDGE